MKNWEAHQKAATRVLRLYGRRYYGGDARFYNLVADAVAYGICEAWDVDHLGMDDEQVERMVIRHASRFASKEMRYARRAIPTEKIGPEGDTYSAMDYFTSTRATQEDDVDAAKVRKLVGSEEMLELIAYGDKAEGGIGRIRAERTVREALGTYRPLTSRVKSQ